MIRVAALLCGCSLALVACYGGSRAAIVRSAAPVAICLDGRDAETPSWRRICPDRIATRASVARRVGATRLRATAELAPWDLRHADAEREAARQDYIRRVILRQDTSAMHPPADAEAAIDASLLAVPVASPGDLALPYAPLGDVLRGRLD